MDQNRHRKLILDAVLALDREVDLIQGLIDESLPECWSGLAVKTQTAKGMRPGHPVDHLAEYQDLEKKLEMDLSRLENITTSLRRRIAKVSHRAKDVLRMAAWSPDLMEEHLGGGGGNA